MYETFEHTADVGLRVSAPDLDGLFAFAAQGLVATLVHEPVVSGGERMTFSLQGKDLIHLLVDFLSELLFIFDSQGLVLGDFEVSVSDSGVSASARARSLDPEVHGLQREVKAVTYHSARVTEAADGWVAELILDV